MFNLICDNLSSFGRQYKYNKYHFLFIQFSTINLHTSGWTFFIKNILFTFDFVNSLAKKFSCTFGTCFYLGWSMFLETLNQSGYWNNFFLLIE